jgi:hypothetical protein
MAITKHGLRSKIFAGAGTLTLAAALAFCAVASPAFAATASAGTWSDLRSAFSSAANGTDTTITLTASITNTAAGQHLTVPGNGGSGGAHIILDLNGHNLTIEAIDSGASINAGAGIGVMAGATLTVQDSVGTGTLTASGDEVSAGIGLGYYFDNGSGYVAIDTVPREAAIGGDIIINSGTVIATGGDYANGLGGAYYAAGGSITINGGTVKAYGGVGSPGIGTSAYAQYEEFNLVPTSVAINGGTIFAYGGEPAGEGDGSSPGIGRAFDTDPAVPVEDITVTGCANITAVGGSGTDPGNVTADWSGGSPGIGSGSDGGSTGQVAGGLTLDGVAPAGSPTSVSNGTDGYSAGGIGSAITYTGNTAFSLAVNTSTPAGTSAGGTFQLTCLGLPDTGFGVETALVTGLVAAALTAAGIVLVTRRRARA